MTGDLERGGIVPGRAALQPFERIVRPPTAASWPEPASESVIYRRLPAPLDDDAWDDDLDEPGTDRTACLLGWALWAAWLTACAAAGLGIAWAITRRWPR